jgi:hypothetical protein
MVTSVFSLHASTPSRRQRSKSGAQAWSLRPSGTRANSRLPWFSARTPASASATRSAPSGRRRALLLPDSHTPARAGSRLPKYGFSLLLVCSHGSTLTQSRSSHAAPSACSSSSRWRSSETAASRPRQSTSARVALEGVVYTGSEAAVPRNRTQRAARLMRTSLFYTRRNSRKQKQQCTLFITQVQRMRVQAEEHTRASTCAYYHLLQLSDCVCDAGHE